MKKILPLTLALTSSMAIAQESIQEYGIVGASGTFGQSVYSTDNSANFGLTPTIFYYSNHGFIDGSLINVSVLPYLGISGNWRFSEVSDTFDSIPTGINERKGSLELGVTLGTPGARLTYLHDVSNVHQGSELQLHLGKTFATPLSDLSLTPFVEVDWRDKKLSNHVYGVSVAESLASGLAEYNPSTNLVYKAGLIGLYDLSDNFVVLSKGRIERHDDESPIVQRKLGYSFELGLTYKFAG
ncbi:MipA/OmpV family protein [Vibrio caribbeanicus]|uniref:Outer membrane protein V n=1 Tax=Vibrio caribbeanicus ATCC BAA-2122 TaxID=796620 RepID=E3BEE1_9VIBR|nr:MipA/OmpV family protein [Vibrio caribbeanicus]EFP98558.1 Outer membrane protein V [Vibrio caribbeanicus ATCC BAA-2122]